MAVSPREPAFDQLPSALSRRHCPNNRQPHSTLIDLPAIRDLRSQIHPIESDIPIPAAVTPLVVGGRPTAAGPEGRLIAKTLRRVARTPAGTREPASRDGKPKEPLWFAVT
jgi:hypothetical protein